MPVPLIVWAIGCVVAGAFGGGLGVYGKVNKDAANDRIRKASNRYEREKLHFENVRESSNAVISDLGEARLKVQESFKRFEDAFEKIKNRPEFREREQEHFEFTSIDLNNVREVSISAKEAIAGVGGAGAAGAAATAGTYFLVGLLGSASTGTPIAVLAGAAAQNAILAWLGGGALAAGGAGIAGGIATLGFLGAGPAILAAGAVMYYYGNEAIEKADEAEKLADETINKMHTIESCCKSISGLASALLDELRKAQGYYNYKVGQLEDLVNRCDDYNMFSKEDKILLDNNIMLIKILMDMTQVDLLMKDEQGVPILEEESIRQNEVRGLAARADAVLSTMVA